MRARVRAEIARKTSPGAARFETRQGAAFSREMWDDAAEAAKLARGYESVNFNGNTPLGAMIALEESLSLARTTDERLSRQPQFARRRWICQAEILAAALEVAATSLNAWRLCSKG